MNVSPIVLGRATALADAYDALRTYRPYRYDLVIKKTLSIMQPGRGTEFEPEFCDHSPRTVLVAQAGTGA